MNPLAIAAQGLGFTAALIAMQGLLQFVVEEVQKYESTSGGGIKTKRRVSTRPLWVPETTSDDDEALLMILGAI